MIENGRYDQTPRDKRFYPVCDSNELEVEIHFLFHCPKYSILKNDFFHQITSYFTNFEQIPYSDLCRIID